MAIYHNNIDIVDSARLTKAPFTWECTNIIGDVTLPVNLFRSIKVYMNEDNVPPARLYGVKDNKLIFTDSNGTIIGYFDTTDNSSGSGFILTSSDLIRGHVVANSEMPVIIRSISISHPDGVYTDYGDFSLLPKCHVKTFKGICKAIALRKDSSNGTKYITTGDLYIKGGRGTIIENIDDTLKFSVYNDVSVSVDGYDKGNGIYILHVTNSVTNMDTKLSVQDRHLFITHKEKSNIRIVNSNSQIVLKGVTDA